MATKVTDLPAVTQPFISSDNLLVSKHVTITSGLLTIGEEYTILDFNTGDNFSNVANVISGTINTTGCVFTATGTTPTTYSNGSTLAYYQSQKYTLTDLRNALGLGSKVYIVNLTQSGTSAPSIVVGINTLGGVPSPSRATDGAYLLTLTGAFLNGKTFVKISGSSNGFVEAFRTSDDEIRINTYSGGVGADSIMTSPTCLEVITIP